MKPITYLARLGVWLIVFCKPQAILSHLFLPIGAGLSKLRLVSARKQSESECVALTASDRRKRKPVSFHVLAFSCLLAISSNAWATLLTASDMYLDPSAITHADYSYNYFSTGYTATFSNVQRLQVLPAFNEDGVTYYANPTTDYVGDITGSSGSMTFNKPGPYFVQATYLDNTKQLFDYGIDFQVHPAQTGPTYKWKQIPTPKPDVVVSGPDVNATDPNYGPGTTTKFNFTTWAQVTAYLQTLNNKHVELGGHGSPGKFYWNGTLVLDDSTQSTKDWLTSMAGHIDYLTFMSCYTGAGSVGMDFLKLTANTLGKAGGYTEAVGGNGTDWFINNDGKLVTVPEPPSIMLVVCGGVMLLMILRRRMVTPAKNGDDGINGRGVPCPVIRSNQTAAYS